ncbi:unnamed protein product [Ceutorhynchus assimilis]|uniref:AMP-dependent synthetase/ligase domain-containing protein n=1 Tax=Ceutorhynchus assimilis TaxID=467358 RepID=A0A9N9QRK8_9CUCU|nr:unnamed protein product [Ceutorhynchus assimilis]
MIFNKASKYQNKIAIRDVTGQYSYHDILTKAQVLSSKISKQLNGKTGERVLFLCPNDASYVVTIWAIWMSGQIAVPLSPQHPQSLVEYYCTDTNSSLLVTSSQYEQHLSKLSKQVNLFVLDEDLFVNNKSLVGTTAKFYNDAMILYTSGTTGKPKGVVLTQKHFNSS